MTVGIRRLRKPVVFSRSSTFAFSRDASLEMFTRDLAADEAREDRTASSARLASLRAVSGEAGGAKTSILILWCLSAIVSEVPVPERRGPSKT